MSILLIFISFFLVAFGQPAWIPGFGMLASAFGFALFWRAMLTFSRPRDRFLLSLGWFAFVQGVQLSWMATLDYMGPLILVLYLFLILAMGAQFGLLSFLFKIPLSLFRSLAIAGSWVILEWLRLFFLCGFTWNPIGLALADCAYSLQFSSVFGIFGLSFWVMLVNLTALNAILQKSIQKAALWASLAFFPYLFGFLQQAYVESHIPPSRTIRVALIQTALFPEQKDFLHEYPHAHIPPLEQWERILSILDKDQKVDLILFPEAPLLCAADLVLND